MELEQKKAIHEQIDEKEIGYFKYFSDDIHVIDGIFRLNKIRFTQPWCLNDPLEFNPRSIFRCYDNKHIGYIIGEDYYPGDDFWYRIKHIESQINSYGLLSLTKIADSFDMWSRYANGHKGFLIEFKSSFNNMTCMKSKSGVSYPIKKVEYVDDYYINIDDIIENKLSKEDVEYLFFKKINRWEHEQEYRMVRPLSDYSDYRGPIQNISHRDDKVYLFEFPLDCIESIVFGTYMSVENKRLIMKYCENFQINFLQATLFRDQKDNTGKQGHVFPISLDNFGSLDIFLNMKPQFFCMDYELFTRLTENGIKKVSSIYDLPYFKNEDLYLLEEYIQNLRLKKTAEE